MCTVTSFLQLQYLVRYLEENRPMYGNFRTYPFLSGSPLLFRAGAGAVAVATTEIDAEPNSRVSPKSDDGAPEALDKAPFQWRDNATTLRSRRPFALENCYNSVVCRNFVTICTV